MKKSCIYGLGFLLVFGLLFSGCANSKANTTESSGQEEPRSFSMSSDKYDYDNAKLIEPQEIQTVENYVIQEYLEQNNADQDNWEKALAVFEKERSIYVQGVTTVSGEGTKISQMLLPTKNGEVDITGPLKELSSGEMPQWISGVYRDGQGYFFVLTGDHIYLLDPEGNPVAGHFVARSDSCYLGEPIISDMGALIFCTQDSESSQAEIFFFDTTTGEKKVIAVLTDKYFRTPLCALRGDNLFYRSNQDIICMNINTGERQKVFELMSTANDQSVIIGFTPEGELLLYATSMLQSMGSPANALWIARLGTKPESTGVVLRIDDMYNNWDNKMVTSAVKMFQVSHSQWSIDYREGNEDTEFRTKMLADLTNDQGADVLFVSREDMYMLYEKGATVELTELISEDTLRELLPGVLELGTMENKLVGIPPYVYASALFVSKEEYDKPTWSMKEFMEYTESHEKKYAWINHYNGHEGFSNAYSLMLFSGFSSLKDMGLLDYSAGVASLEDGRYEKLLSFCKKYEQETTLSKESLNTCLKEKQSSAFVTGYLYDFLIFQNMAEFLGENMNAIGFPMGETSANYLDSCKYMVVTKKAYEDENKREAIVDWIEYILSAEGQKNIEYNLSVRIPTDDMLREEVVIDDDYFPEEKFVYVRIKDTRYRTTVLKADGSSYVEDFKEFLKNCKATPYLPTEIKKILTQEYAPYFAGEADVKTVAAYSQNRVQLYLEEQK